MRGQTRNWEFIKMCQKAEEIQQLWEPISGDLYLYKNAFGPRPNVLSSDIHGSIISWEGKQRDRFWLPRQEDLQAILLKHGIDNPHGNPEHWALYCKFTEYMDTTPGTHEDFNKYWLLFAMEYIFNKTWNPETKTWEAL